MKAFITVVFVSLIFLFGAKMKLIDSTSQEWAGGIYESGYGTNYKATLIAKGGSEKLQVNELWIGKDYFEVKAMKNLAKRSDLSFVRKDTIYIVSSINFKPDTDGAMVQVNSIKKDPPKSFKGDALLGYTWKGKKKYLEIKSFRKLEKLIFP
ncbi:MAG: hypothetical protein KAH17_01750 [Bacteroidales bacterium]|nr:hypothetical protein [Bacteroidales bacterium]